MGTRGAFGVIIGEQEKIGYNQFDSYPEGRGIEQLQWVRQIVFTKDYSFPGDFSKFKTLAEECEVVDDSTKPTKREKEALRGWTDLNVSEQSTDDWYCLTRDTHGSIENMLRCGFIYDNRDFPLDSLFCEWAYIVDFDQEVFEVYQGFQKKLPKKGRWAGRPTKEEDAESYKLHLEWCKNNDREPWKPKVSEYKAVELIASYPFDALPSDEEFLSEMALIEAKERLKDAAQYPGDVADVVNRIVEEGYADEGKPFASEWADLEETARTLVAKYSSPAETPMLTRD